MTRILITYNTTKYLVRFRRLFIERLRAGGVEVHALTPEDHFVPELCSLGVHWHPWDVSRHSANPLLELRALLSTYRVVRKVRPQAVVNVTLKAVLYGGLVGFAARVPRRIALVAGLGNVLQGKGVLSTAVRLIYRQTIRSYHGVMVQNSDDERAVHGLLRSRDPTAVLKLPGSGVNLHEFSPPSERTYAPRPIVMMVTRLVWTKGLREFCQVASQLREKADFVLIGALDSNPDSPSREAITSLAAASGVQLRLDVKDVAHELRKADLFVYPSYYPEGIPRSVLEALAVGVPVITTTSPGCREAVQHGCEGLVIPPRDPVVLAHAIESMLSDRGMLHRFGQAARKRAEAMYDESYVARRMADFVINLSR